MELQDCITDLAGLRAIYREPSEGAANKSSPTIDDTTAAFIDRCPFLVIATSDGAGSMDASPRGGPPGFLQRLDDRHLAIPDLNGNNRLDTLENLVANPAVGLLLVMPGKDETVRINGTARLTTDATVLDRFTVELRRPKLAIVVEVAEQYGHCAKAFRRAKVWDPVSWAGYADAPDLAQLAGAKFGLGTDDMRTMLEASYEHGLALD